MKCPSCGHRFRHRKARRPPPSLSGYNQSGGPVPSAPMNPLLIPRPPSRIEEEFKLTSCLGCGVCFTREFKPNETCPVCLKTVGWKEIGKIRNTVA